MIGKEEPTKLGGKKLKLSHQELNRGLRCKKPESNRLSYGTDILYHLDTEMFIAVDNEILRIISLYKKSLINRRYRTRIFLVKSTATVSNVKQPFVRAVPVSYLGPEADCHGRSLSRYPLSLHTGTALRRYCLQPGDNHFLLLPVQCIVHSTLFSLNYWLTK
jgi:hypothetical protein